MLIKHEDNDSQMKPPLVSFSSNWNVLGPFQIGTREASWGADPLEHLGGFRALKYDAQAKYKSSLATNGLVYWSSKRLESRSNDRHVAEAVLTVAFPHVDWPLLQSVYGWTALQYQAWARGYLDIVADSVQSVVLFTDSILEFWVDDEHHFGGDFYSYHRAPLVLHLAPGHHQIDLRLVRDVRLMGAVGDPNISSCLRAEISHDDLTVDEQKVLISDTLEGSLASPFASIPVRNNSKDWIFVQGVTSVNGTCTVSLLEREVFQLAPGQSRSLGLRLFAKAPLVESLSLEVTYTTCESPKCLVSIVISHKITTRTIHEPHKVSFLHPGGIVSYAILRAPSRKVASEMTPKQSLPILLNLHGAGLEADSHQVRHMLDPVPDLHAWVLYPTGGNPWSADDWHTWGFADVEAAISMVGQWTENHSWKGPSVDTNRWLVSGHSNGGQGTWYALTHRPDNIIGAAPVSAYSSIQGYVPYQMWKEADPRVTCILQTSLRSFRHELLVANFEGIPIQQQHGGADDNVPAFHSRRMNQLVSQPAKDTAHSYAELENKGHWFEGVMASIPLRKFYVDILDSEDKPEPPQEFSLVIANPADMTSRGGLIVDQLISPDQLGNVNVSINFGKSTWILRTSNVLRFHFSFGNFKPALRDLVIDETSLKFPSTNSVMGCWLLRSHNGKWQICRDGEWKATQRHGSQSGPLDSIMRTRGRFSIQTLSPGLSESDVALQVSRNLFQYFGADAQIIDSIREAQFLHGNVISVATGEDYTDKVQIPGTIDVIKGRGLVIHKSDGRKRIFEMEKGLGAIFLRHLDEERLELVVWGYDDQGLRQAARLVPMLTGVGQPDFVIVGKSCAWDGAAGVLAMGSFDSYWKVSEASFVH